MSWQTLDFYFPFFVFFYGCLMVFVLGQTTLMEIAERRFPQNLVLQMKSHFTLGWICFVIGGFWSLQNLWFSY